MTSAPVLLLFSCICLQVVVHQEAKGELCLLFGVKVTCAVLICLLLLVTLVEVSLLFVLAALFFIIVLVALWLLDVVQICQHLLLLEVM